VIDSLLLLDHIGFDKLRGANLSKSI